MSDEKDTEARPADEPTGAQLAAIEAGPEGAPDGFDPDEEDA